MKRVTTTLSLCCLALLLALPSHAEFDPVVRPTFEWGWLDAIAMELDLRFGLGLKAETTPPPPPPDGTMTTVDCGGTLDPNGKCKP